MSKKFDEYVTQEVAEAGLISGQFCSGVLRVNPKRPSDGFCVSGVSDILIKGKFDRNRAFNGDSIVVEIFPESEWHRPSGDELQDSINNGVGGLNISLPSEEDNEILLTTKDFAKLSGLAASGSRDSRPAVAARSLATSLAEMVAPTGVVKTGKVVFVAKAAWEDRVYACSLQPNRAETSPLNTIGAEDKIVRAVPVDKRIPWILISINDFVKRALNIPGYLDPNILYPVQVLKWTETGALPLGRLKGIAYGRVGEPEVEAKVCLAEAGLDAHEEDFPKAVHAEVEKLQSNFQSDLELEAKRRIDLRSKRIFTIDPASARDLDDAIHIEIVDEEFVEIGVHIADVAHYVQDGSETDKVAKDRCTSVYMCHRVYPMLPEGLSNSLCSLNANEPKLTFTSWYRIRRATGEVILDSGDPNGPRFAKTIIQSCCRFSYEEAQEILDGVEIPLTKRPPVFAENGWHSLCSDMFLLFDICSKVRARRFDHGSVRIDKTKMRFKLDDRDVPVSYSFETHSASHWMIEELMLLSNEVVAKKISQLGDSAVLRRHPAPEPKSFGELSEKIKTKLGMAEWDGSTSGALFKSLQAIRTKLGDRMGQLVEFLVMKTMRPAQYCSLGSGDIHHYALAFDFYTHFTSPIRRYPDIMVHRQLQMILELNACGIDPKETPSVDPSPEEIAAIEAQCNECNVMKRKSRLAQEACDVSFFCIYLRDKKEVSVAHGTVMSITDKCFNVYVPKLNKDSPVYFNLTSKIPDWYLTGSHREELDRIVKGPHAITFINDSEAAVLWTPEKEVRVRLFDSVSVVIVPLETVPISFTLLLLPPDHTRGFDGEASD